MGGKAGKKATTSNLDRPWVENYPPLRDFLRGIEARCDWQLPYGPKDRPVMCVEQWRAPGSAPFIVVVRSDQHGWDIYTPCLSEKIDATIEDVRKRIFYPKPEHASSGPMDEGGD